MPITNCVTTFTPIVAPVAIFAERPGDAASISAFIFGPSNIPLTTPPMTVMMRPAAKPPRTTRDLLIAMACSGEGEEVRRACEANLAWILAQEPIAQVLATLRYASATSRRVLAASLREQLREKALTLADALELDAEVFDQ